MGGVISAGMGQRGVTAARNWRFGVASLGFVLVEVLFLVGGVAVDSVKKPC